MVYHVKSLEQLILLIAVPYWIWFVLKECLALICLNAINYHSYALQVILSLNGIEDVRARLLSKSEWVSSSSPLYSFDMWIIYVCLYHWWGIVASALLPFCEAHSFCPPSFTYFFICLAVADTFYQVVSRWFGMFILRMLGCIFNGKMLILNHITW